MNMPSASVESLQSQVDEFGVVDSIVIQVGGNQINNITVKFVLFDDELVKRIANLGRCLGRYLRQHLGRPCIRLMRVIFHKGVM